MQIYAEAESRANEFIQIAMPRRNSISAAGKYTQKPRAEQMNLFKLLCRQDKKEDGWNSAASP